MDVLSVLLLPDASVLFALGLLVISLCFSVLGIVRLGHKALCCTRPIPVSDAHSNSRGIHPEAALRCAASDGGQPC